jgi:tetratricopeptide (TPR) repeat protein
MSWTPALVSMGIGVIGGMLLLLSTRKQAQFPDASLALQDDLEQQKDQLYEAIRQARQDESETELSRLELEAAQVLARLDMLKIQPAELEKLPTLSSRYPQATGAIWGATLMLFLALLAGGLQNHSTPKKAETQQSSSTEEVLSPAQQAELAKIAAAAQASPDNVALQNDYAHALIQANKLMEAWELSSKIVERDPQNAEARTHQGFILFVIGEEDKAIGVLDTVLKFAPEEAEALMYRGLLYARTRDPAKRDLEKAAATWELAIKADPELEPTLRPILLQLAAAPPASTPAPLETGQEISGEVKIPEGAPLPSSGYLIVKASPAGVTRGPPVAALKIPLSTGSTTVAFKIGPQNSIMGGSFSGELLLTAWVDEDGNVTTHTPHELTAKSQPVTPGTTGLSLVLEPAP